MTTIIDADAAKLAGLQIDLLTKLRGGHITLEDLFWFTQLNRAERDDQISYYQTLKWRRSAKDRIHFNVTSDGATGKEIVSRLKKKGVWLSEETEDFIRSSFRPTSGVTTGIVVMHEVMSWFGHRVKGGEELGFRRLTVETSCLVCLKFRKKDLQQMGLNELVVPLGEALPDTEQFEDRTPTMFISTRHSEEKETLYMKQPSHNGEYGFRDGFVFAHGEAYA